LCVTNCGIKPKEELAEAAMPPAPPTLLRPLAEISFDGLSVDILDRGVPRERQLPA
jgi:hypothetical protein